MNRLKRMNILTVEIIREFGTGSMLENLLQFYRKRQLARELLLEQETPVKEV